MLYQAGIICPYFLLPYMTANVFSAVGAVLTESLCRMKLVDFFTSCLFQGLKRSAGQGKEPVMSKKGKRPALKGW